MQTFEDKNKGMYPVAKGKKPRIEREDGKVVNISLAVASSCSYGNKIVESHLLNKDAISKMGKGM